MQKKGQMLSVFKYIFVLIVGALFIIFFVRFALNYQSGAEKIDRFTFLHSFDDILSALSGSSNADKTISFVQETELLMTEGEIRAGEASKKSEKVIYAPLELKGKTIKIWARRWAFPYPVDNFFYITNENHNYLIFPSPAYEEYAKTLTDPLQEIPKDFNTLLVLTNAELNKLKPSITPRTKLIMLGKDPVLESNLKKLSGEIIIIQPESEEEPEYGTIEFKNKELPYYGRAMLLGAVYGDEDSYEYNLGRAFEKLSLITDIYIKKAGYLNSKKPGCAYNLFSTNLESLKQQAETRDQESIILLYTRIQDTNKDLGRGCPSVF